METFALRSIARQYGPERFSYPKDLAFEKKGVPLGTTGHFEPYQVESVEKESRGNFLFSPACAAESEKRSFLGELKIEEVTDLAARVASKKEAYENENASIVPAVFINLDKLRRGEQNQDFVGTVLTCLSSAINKIYDNCDAFFNSPLDIAPEVRAALLNQKYGFTGLSNHHGTCYLNSALQFSAEVIRMMKHHESLLEHQVIDQNLDQWPYLTHFAYGTLATNDDQRRLYREISRGVSKNFWFGAERFTLNQLETGFKKGGLAMPYIEHLLMEIQIPSLRFQEKLGGRAAFYQVRVLLDGQANEFRKLQDVASSAKLVGEVPPYFIRKCSFEKKETEALKEVQLAHQDDHGNVTTITFAPKAVAIRLSHHAFCCIEKGDRWYEINDSWIQEIPKAWEEELFHFMSENGSIILYKQQVDLSPKQELKTDGERVKQNIEEDGVSEERKTVLLDDPNSMTETWKNLVENLSRNSFYYYQYYQQLLKVEGKEPAPALLTLRERVHRDLEQKKRFRKDQIWKSRLAV